MAKLDILKGSTSQSVDVFIQDSSVTTGAGKTGLAFNTGSLVAYYHRIGSSATAITLATQTVNGAWSSGGFVEVDSANMPGLYRLDIPDAVLATGVRAAVIMLKGAANMAPCVLEIQLTNTDNQDGVRNGMTALPNAAAEAAGGLYTRGTGAGQIKQTNNGEIDANATHVNNIATSSVTTVNANVGTTQPTNFTGTGASALVKGDAIDLAGQVITAGAGVTFPSSVASPTNITAGTITTATNLTNNNDKTGYALTAGEHTNIATDTQTGLTAQGYTTTRAGYLDTLNGIVAAIWANVTRTLSAGTNIVLAKGVGVTGFNDVSTAQVLTQMQTALSVDAYAEPTSAPAATSSLKDKIGWTFKLSRNLRKTTSTVDSVYDDAGAVVTSTSTISDDGTTFTRGEYT